MSTAALKRELGLLRSSLAALKPSQSATLDDPVAWAEGIAELRLDPWQRDVLLSPAPRLLLNATRQSGKSTAAGLKAAWTPAMVRPPPQDHPATPPGSVFDAEVLAHMFGDHTEEEPDTPASIVQGRI